MTRGIHSRLGRSAGSSRQYDHGMVELLAESRCRAVFVGLETVSGEGLKSIHKGWVKPEAARPA